MGKKENDDTKADIQLLLECLEYQKGNNSAVKQALVTLSSALCESASSNAQDIFRSAGGIQKILNIVTKTKTDEITEVCLFCLGNAVEKNVYSQKLLSNASFFHLLHGILSPSSSTASKKRQMAAFVLLCLVSNNSFGQNMARQSSCLHDILSLIRTSLSRGSDSYGSRDVELWATLVRAACVCVNNPVNEENQRICSTLFPYLLSVVGNHTEDRVLKSALSLMCLTISYNAQNQGKFTRCGGLQILIRKLKSLLNEKEDTGKQQVAVQLICTLDVCLTENERNSKAFGELGGLVLVLNMLLVPGLISQDKIQLVLTLAHAVDAYSANKDSLSQGNAIKTLIQQMTETTNEELTKTTKYLLHMCVSTDNTISDDDDDDELPKMDAFATKLEEMKRKSDLEILQKLNDLDSKLNVIGNRDPDTSRTMYENVGSLGNPETYLSDISELSSHQFATRPASVCSSNNTSCKHQCPTPREKTLLEELVKERVEKEKLEKLNQLLQEDVVSSRAALAKETENQKRNRTQSKKQEIEESDTSQQHRSFLQYQTINPYQDSSITHKQFASEINELQNNQNLNAGFHNASSMDSLNPNPNSFYEKEVLPAPIMYDDVIYQSGFGPQKNVLYAYPVFDSARVAQGTMGHHSNHKGNAFLYETSINTTTGMPVDLTVDSSNRQMPGSSRKETVSSVNGNMNQNLNHNVQVQTQSNSSVVSSGKNMNVGENLNANLIEKQNETLKVSCEEPSKALNSNNSSITRSQTKQNAEIQCGTPYVNSENTKDAKISTRSDGSSQTYFQTRINAQKRKLIEVSTGIASPRVNNATAVNEIVSAYSKDSCDKVAKVVINDVLSTYSLKNKSRRSQSNVSVNEQISIRKIGENRIKQPTDTFLKPMAAPPRKKVRVTPLMGSKKVLNRSDSGVQKKNIETHQTPCFSDIESEFDLELARVIKNPHKKTVRIGEINQSMVYGKNSRVKSQNNTRKIDRHLDDSRQDTTQTWNVTPTTPEDRHVIPVRPAFSDCGMRRFNMYDSPYSVKSVGCLGKNNLNDDSMNTPTDIKQGSPDSSLDSSIEGCRSSSDVSDEDINTLNSLNITAAALRSNKKILNSKLCPGCNKSSDDKGNLLTSRTYNIALEMNPHTCKYHRKLRVYERCFIKSTKQQISKGKRRSGRLLNFKNSPAENFNSNSFDYTSSIDDPDNISPPDQDDDSVLINFKQYNTSKKRRQRLSYTREEEDNLREGVRTTGKYWNQILNTYSFHPSRTNVDLMDKYKRMVAVESGLSEMNSTKSSRCSKPFSLCEERRLRKGMNNFGHNWKAILKSYSFEKGRTSEDLRNRWRVLHKHLGLD